MGFNKMINKKYIFYHFSEYYSNDLGKRIFGIIKDMLDVSGLIRFVCLITIHVIVTIILVFELTYFYIISFFIIIFIFMTNINT